MLLELCIPFTAENRALCQGAELARDRFHVLTTDGRKLIDRIGKDKAAQKVVKRSKGFLLAYLENLAKRIESLLAQYR